MLTTRPGATVCLSLLLALANGVGLLGAQATVGAARTVLAAVVDDRGRPVVDVGVDDVVVSEGGTPREVLDVHIADYPLAVVIDDRPTSIAIATLRSAARRFVERAGDRPVALIRLSDASQPVVGLDDDRATLLGRLDSLDVAQAAVASPLESIARAATLLGDSGAPFSAVVVVAAAPVDATELVRGELLTQILESGAAVHVVQALTGQDTVGADADNLLRVVARQSKGQFTPIFAAASYDAALDRLGDRLAIELMIQYVVQPGPRAGDVRIGVRRPGSRAIGLGVK